MATTCTHCHGRGWVHDFVLDEQFQCSACDGHGWIGDIVISKEEARDITPGFLKVDYPVTKITTDALKYKWEGPRKTIYLGGPMAGCTIEEMTGWRERLKKEWTEFDFRDPCDRSYEPQQWKQLVKDDLADIDASDIGLWYMWKPGVGSSMEIVEARYRNKPTIIVIPDFKYVSPWIREYADFLVEDFEHAYKIIKMQWKNAGVEEVHHP